MHVRVRVFGKPDTIVAVKSKLTKIDEFRRIIRDKFNIEPKLQRLLYGGKLLENGYTFHDYNIKLNDVIQLMVKVQPSEVISTKQESKNDCEVPSSSNKQNEEREYKDARSMFYEVGNLVDVIDHDLGAWFEGKITRIVYNPSEDVENTHENDSILDKENDAGNKPVSEGSLQTAKSKSKGIAKYYNEIPKGKKKRAHFNNDNIAEDKLLYQIELDNEDDDTKYYHKFKEIRPRARTVINIEDLKVGETVMVNYNLENSTEKGYWHDFKVVEIIKYRKTYKLLGTLYHGRDMVPQHDTTIKIIDDVYKIEQPVPLLQQTDEYKKLLASLPKLRSAPVRCLECCDNENVLCKECGCYLCSKKGPANEIILCDECDYGYHISCLTPPLTEVPDGDWYCPSCKRDPNDIIAPGASKQTKKTTKTSRDWGRGMACAGKTKSCSMPPNHFGPIPGVNVGMCWRFRIQVSESGVHRPPVSGIHGRDTEGAYSIVLSGGYEDDYDNGHEFTYTGSGGRDLSGNKRTAEQSCDQTLTRENRALARNCAVPKVSEEGGDAGDDWRGGKPVRVVRSQKMLKHFPKYAPKEGIRYDGIYKVVKYYPERGKSGYIVWKYLLRRDDPSPAPWEPGAKQYPMIYPDGYLEAEKEKKALEKKTKAGSKKRKIPDDINSTTSDVEASPPAKIKKTSNEKTATGKSKKASKGNILDWINSSLSNEEEAPSVQKEVKRKKVIKSKAVSSRKKVSDSPMKSPKKSLTEELSVETKMAISKDVLNAKLWGECLACFENTGKKDFVQFVIQSYFCIICQDVAANPVTTPCLHNFCLACIKRAFKALEEKNCPCCRTELKTYEPEVNQNLKDALQSILTGYDCGRL